MLRTRSVRFIEPRGREGRPFNAWIGRWPLLGPVMLATILRQRGYDAAVYNENVSGALEDNPAAYADVCSADVVGITIMTPTASRGYALAQKIKRDSPETIIALGGVHATFLPEEAAKYADIVVRGEGEGVIESIACGEVTSGIIDAPAVQDLDSLPAPDFRLIANFERLLKRFGRAEDYPLPMMASRGCPFGCTYCSVSRMFGRRVRRQSVDKVHRDVRSYLDQGFRRVFFYDDNFTSDRRWTRNLLERLSDANIAFDAQARADFPWLDGSRKSIDKPLLNAMRKAGGDMLYIGYETVEDSTAAEWNKGYRGGGALQDRLLEDTRILHDNGFWIHGMFVMGPRHTRETARRIVNFARTSGMETMQISILTPLPGTPLYEEMRPHLLLQDYPGDWDFYDGTHCVYDNAALGIGGMEKEVFKAHRSFYRWGGWSARRMRALLEGRGSFVRKLGSLWVNARTARRVLREWKRELKFFLEFVKDRTSKSSEIRSQV